MGADGSAVEGRCLTTLNDIGQLVTIVKKIPGAARGILKHVKGDTAVTDEASLQSALD